MISFKLRIAGKGIYQVVSGTGTRAIHDAVEKSPNKKQDENK